MQAGGIARTWRAAQWLLIMLGAIGSAPAAVDDSVVQDVRIEGNQAISSAALSSAIMLKSGAALSRELVLADVERIEALYQRAGKRVAVATDLTHPGEHEGNPRTTLTFRINESPKTHGAQASASADPLEIYYDNTLVCAAAKTLNDLCHLWLNRDGTFINFDLGEAKAGHYTVGPMRADGKVPVCQYWDTPAMVSPDEVKPQMGPPPPSAPAPAPAPASALPSASSGAASALICRTQNYRSVCQRVDPSTLSEQDRKNANLSMGQRFYRGLCYPIGPHEIGDIWFEADDPLPGQLGMDRVLLLPGRQ